MKRPFALFALAVLAPCAAAAADSPGADALARKSEACIRAHAATVVRFSPSLADAVSFLVDDLCAPPIEAYRNYQRSEQTLAMYKDNGLAEAIEDEDAPPSRAKSAKARQRAADTKAMFEAITIDPDTGDLHLPQGQAGGLGTNIVITASIGTNHEARFRAIAAEAVLEVKNSVAPRP